jgi:hypothetical protein
MYTATKIEQINKEKPSMWRIKTSEQIDLKVVYRYGFIVLSVEDETLFKHRVSQDLSDSTSEWVHVYSFLKEYLPEEMIDFSLIMTKENG